MSEISEKANKLIKDFRRDISIDIMFTPEKNAEVNSLNALIAYIAELEKDNADFRQLVGDWSIVLEQDDYFQLWHVESVRQAMLEINKESEE